jgi:predicted nucleic acid-binding protein
VFLDTGGLFAMVNGEDPDHAKARNLSRAARQLTTHGGILFEFVALCGSRRIPRRKTLGFLRDLLIEPRLKLIWIEETLHDSSMTLLERRLDKGYSLVDATSFVIMRRLRIREALTTDHHFEQEGFVRLLKPG